MKPATNRLLHYQPNLALIDEAMTADGKVQPNWEYLLASLNSLGASELSERQKKALRMLRDDGATYNIYNRATNDSTWLLDLVPFLIDSTEWSLIEAGIQERAELFNLILKDIYGERELITRGIIPPELIFGHKSFLRSCHGLQLSGEHQLIIHAVDMLRKPDGSMCVLADRTQAPSGAGYALENRTVMSRVLPSLFRDSHVHRLSNYFQMMRQKLISLAPNVAAPRIVVLSPGSYNETYFEHSYLADYLGFNLVQSSDLVVRNGFVWLKSLDGLNRVDVILRRVDDYFCDPVELKGDSQLGIPGLLQVVRLGNVAVANPLGSGVLENPALMRFLPKIAKHFLGRKLRLQSVKTWWCGDKDDLDYVLNNIDDLVIKKVFRSSGVNSVVVSEINNEARKKLIEAIKYYPLGYVAQTKLLPSSMPVFNGTELVSRPALLRTYAVAAQTSYRVMPGGLTRAGLDPGSSLISNQLGSVSKDTWVLASEPEKQSSVWAQPAMEDQLIEDTTLPSRVVENLFWMGRYAERAENGLRMVRTVFKQLSSVTNTTRAADLLLESVTQITATYPGFINDASQRKKPEQELLAVILDNKRTGTVSHCVQAMLSSAEESKGVLSTDSQRVINDIRDELEELNSTLNKNLFSAPGEALNPMVSSMLALSGIVQESMIRGIGWHFLDMGRRIERSLQTISLLRATLQLRLDDRDEATVLESLLMTMEGLVSYRRRYQGSLNVRNTLELVLLDTANPRSIIYQLNKLEEHMASLPFSSSHNELEDEQRCIVEAISQLRLSRLSELANADNDNQKRIHLDQLMSRLHYLLTEASNLLSKRFFEHLQGPRQLVDQNWNSE